MILIPILRSLTNTRLVWYLPSMSMYYPKKNNMKYIVLYWIVLLVVLAVDLPIISHFDLPHQIPNQVGQ